MSGLVIGSETSVPPSNSPARAARPWPSCMANIVEPTRESIGASWAIMAAGLVPGGMSPGGSEPKSAEPNCSMAAADMALVTPSATGLTSCSHTGIVSRTHSDRDHATPSRPGASSWVTWLSHRSATRTASVASLRSRSPIDGSPPPATTLRATSTATVVATGPSSGALNIACTADMTCWNCSGGTSPSPIALNWSSTSGGNSAPPVNCRKTSAIPGGRSPLGSGSGLLSSGRSSFGTMSSGTENS